LKNGVCSQYGIYCTKAHNESERRNLLTIYGKDWKRHYEAYQTCVFDKPTSKKYKRKRNKRIDVTDYSHLQASTVEDDFSFMEIVVTGDLSSHMYGGSPLFVPTPPESPALGSIAECSNPQESLRFDNFPSIDLNGLEHASTFCGQEVETGTEICDKDECTTIINVPGPSSSLSIFDHCFPWTFDWSTIKGTVFKEGCSSSSVSDDPKSIAFKENGSCSSGNGYQYSLSNSTSITDQDIELCKSNDDTIIKKVIGSEVCTGNYFPDDKMICRSSQDFDQQDWELKLTEHGYQNSDMLSFCKDELVKVLDEKD